MSTRHKYTAQPGTPDGNNLPYSRFGPDHVVADDKVDHLHAKHANTDRDELWEGSPSSPHQLKAGAPQTNATFAKPHATAAP